MTAETPSDSDLARIVEGDVTLYTEYLERFQVDHEYALRVVQMFLARDRAAAEAGFLAQLWLEDLLAFHGDILADALANLVTTSEAFRLALTYLDRSHLPEYLKARLPTQ